MIEDRDLFLCYCLWGPNFVPIAKRHMEDFCLLQQHNNPGTTCSMEWEAIHGLESSLHILHSDLLSKGLWFFVVLLLLPDPGFVMKKAQFGSSCKKYYCRFDIKQYIWHQPSPAVHVLLLYHSTWIISSSTFVLCQFSTVTIAIKVECSVPDCFAELTSWILTEIALFLLILCMTVNIPCLW